MSEHEMRALAYSEKCARRRRRQEKRRRERINGLIRFSFPFSIGVFSMACLIAALV